jgi:3-(3-hydroxy-phenyl)propionate hydroxylase
MQNSKKPKHNVVIAGGGPTGLTLGAELQLAGVDVAIVERRATQELPGARGGGMHPRTLEVFDQRGIVDRFLSQGKPVQALGFNMAHLDMSDFPTRYPYSLALWQNHIERILAEWVEQLGVMIYRGCEVVGFTQDDNSVAIQLSDGSALQAEYLVGCDGGRSAVRKAAGIEFPGSEATLSWLIAEFEMREEPAWGFREDANGSHGIGKVEESGRVRVVLTEAELQTDTDPSWHDFKQALASVYGTDFGAHNPTWLSRFTDMTRQAVAYRDRRVLLAGDAAHVHPPIGGQGLNLGVQDGMNLGWKLAQVVKGTSPESLLDTYHAERHAVGARVLKGTMAQSALRRRDGRTRALSEYVNQFTKMNEVRKSLVAELSGLGVRYELGDAHPLLGTRIPDLDLITFDGEIRMFSLLHSARPAVVNFRERGGFDITPWRDRVQWVDARCTAAWELPAVGTLATPGAVLVRPDGYVAWASEDNWDGLEEALIRWFGARVVA